MVQGGLSCLDCPTTARIALQQFTQCQCIVCVCVVPCWHLLAAAAQAARIHSCIDRLVLESQFNCLLDGVDKLQLKHMFANAIGIILYADESHYEYESLAITIVRSVPLWRCLSPHLFVWLALSALIATPTYSEYPSPTPHVMPADTVDIIVIVVVIHPHYFWLLCSAISQLCLD